MKFHEYLKDLMGNKSFAIVIRKICYFPEKKWTIRELAKSGGISHTGLIKILPILENNNIAKISRFGNSNVVEFNKNSYIYKNMLKTLFETEENTLNELIADLKKFLTKKIVLAALFGSVSKKSENYSSDIDLLIITDFKDFVEKKVSEMSNFIASKYGNEIIPIILSSEEIKIKISFIKSIKNSAILLKGKWP